MIHVRSLEVFEEHLLPRFLALAAHEEAIEVVLANPALAIYAEDWGREGDCGVVAADERTDMVVGMAWARFWTAEHHGFGWVDEWTPELVVAVEPAFQGKGIGTRLIEALQIELLGVSLRDFEGRIFSPGRVVLNVRADSPAVRFYERLGFEKVEGSESMNRTEGFRSIWWRRFDTLPSPFYQPSQGKGCCFKNRSRKRRESRLHWMPPRFLWSAFSS